MEILICYFFLKNYIFAALGATLWHLQKFLQCIIVVCLFLYTVSLPFHLLLPPYTIERSQSKIKWIIPEINCIIFKLHAILSSIVKSCYCLFCPSSNMNHPFVWCIHTVYTTCLLVT
jgi:hypothetical protein